MDPDSHVVRFVLTAEDRAAFVDHWLATSRVAAKARRTSLMWTSLLVVLVFVALTAVFRSGLIVIAGAVTLGWVVASHPKSFRDKVRKDTGLIAAEGSDLCLGQDHRVEASAAGLRSICPEADTTVPWKAINAVDVTPSHAFLTVGMIRAFVVPRGRLAEGDFEQFVSAAQRWHRESRS